MVDYEFGYLEPLDHGLVGVAPNRELVVIARERQLANYDWQQVLGGKRLLQDVDDRPVLAPGTRNPPPPKGTPQRQVRRGPASCAADPGINRDRMARGHQH